MKRTEDRPTQTLPSVDPADWLRSAGTRPLHDPDSAVSDDLIDILAAVVAIVVMTVVALAF